MSSSPPSRLGQIAFGLWIVGGLLWVGANCHYADRWWAHPDHAFRYVNPTPEEELRARECDRLERLAHFFRWWSIGYALIGLVVFRRHGWSVFLVALAIAALSWFVQLAAGLGHL
jgi:hypothetical protein